MVHIPISRCSSCFWDSIVVLYKRSMLANCWQWKDRNRELAEVSVRVWASLWPRAKSFAHSSMSAGPDLTRFSQCLVDLIPKGFWVLGAFGQLSRLSLEHQIRTSWKMNWWSLDSWILYLDLVVLLIFQEEKGQTAGNCTKAGISMNRRDWNHWTWHWNLVFALLTVIVFFLNNVWLKLVCPNKE